MARSITLVAPGPNAGPSRPATKEETEASWANCLKQKAEGQNTCLSILMSGRSIDDDAARLWCAWFERHCAAMVSNGRKAVAREVNFSENRLTGEGIASICKTFVKLDIPITVLKLYRNQIQKAHAIVELLSWGKGCIRELHLSHNCLDNEAVLKIIVACATITNAKGEHCYPQKAAVPIWLRLERNDKINGPKLGPELQTHLQRLGHSMRKCICEPDENSHCCPSMCCRECSTVPAVHLTYLNLFSRCGPEIVSKRVPLAQPTPAAPGAAPRARAWGLADDAKAQPGKPDVKPEALKGAAVAAAPALAQPKQAASFGASDFPSLLAASAFPGSTPTKEATDNKPATWGSKAKAAPRLEEFPALLQKSATQVQEARVRGAASPQCAHVAPAGCTTEAAPGLEEFPALPQKSATRVQEARVRGAASPQRAHVAPAGCTAEACPPPPSVAWPPLPAGARRAPPGLEEEEPMKCEVPGLGLAFDEEAVQFEHCAEILSDWEEHAEESAKSEEALHTESETLDYVTMLAIRDYDAEADGYVSVAKGDHVSVYLQFQGLGDVGCVWPTYVFAKVDAAGRQGWLPPHVAWERYVDETGRAWAHDASTGDFVWEDEMTVKRM